MAHQCRADVLPATVNQVNDTWRDARFCQNSKQFSRSVGRIFSRLEYHRVATEQGWKQFPRRDRHGKVPWRNQRADTDGRAHRHSKFVRQFRRSCLAEKPSPLAGDIEGSIDSFLDVAACLLQDLAHLPGHAVSDLFLMPAQKLAHLVEDLAPFWRRHEAPERKRLLCGLNRSVYILRAGDRKQANQVVTIRRVMVFKGLP